MASKANKPRIIVALDFSDPEQAEDLAGKLDPARRKLKVGKELFTRAGPDAVRQLVQRGYDVFLDLKFHDIPSTVAAACEAAAQLGVWMLNVHASGGRHMLRSAREAIDRCDHRPLLVGVTVLTSLTAEDLAEVGMARRPVEEQVLKLAQLSSACRLDGVVCSAQEAAMLRAEFGPDFLLITPGIRPSGSGASDQQRVTGPAEALAAGSDYLVIGRPITRAADPGQALAEIEAEIKSSGRRRATAKARP